MASEIKNLVGEVQTRKHTAESVYTFKPKSERKVTENDGTRQVG
jgi:hypothetical protein